LSKKTKSRKPRKPRKVEEIDQLWDMSEDIRSDGSTLDEFPGFNNSEHKHPYLEDTDDVPSTLEVSDTHDVPHTSDAPNTTDVPRTANVPHTSDVPGTNDVPNTIDVPDTDDVPDTTNAPDTDDVPGTKRVLDTTDVPGTKDAPDTKDVSGRYKRRTFSLDNYKWSLSIYEKCMPDQKAQVKRLFLRSLGNFIANRRANITRRIFATSVFDAAADLFVSNNWKVKRDVPYYRKVWKSLQREGYVKLLDMQLEGPLDRRGSVFKVKFPIWIDTNKDVRKASTRRLVLDLYLCKEAIRDGDISVLPYMDSIQKELKRRKIDAQQIIKGGS